MHIILITHIIISIAMLASATGLAFAGVARREQVGLRRVTVLGWVASALSGVLLLGSGASLAHFCASMAVVSLAAVAAERFYSYRLKSSLNRRSAL